MRHPDPNRLMRSDFDNLPRFFTATPSHDVDFTRATPSPDFVEVECRVDFAAHPLPKTPRTVGPAAPRRRATRRKLSHALLFARYAFLCVPGSLFGGYFLPGAQGVLPTLGILVASLSIILATLFLYAICRFWQEGLRDHNTFGTPRETAKRRLLADRARLRPACRARKGSRRP